MRIVSLLPSATEIICALGLQDQLVGVTHECDYPSAVLDLPKVTRTLIPYDATSAEIDCLVRERLTTQRALYTLDWETLERLRPDLIVTQALCDVCAVAEEEVREAACRLSGRPRVLNLEPMSLEDVLDTIWLVGEEVGQAENAEKVVEELRARVEQVRRRSSSIRLRPRVTLLEWIDPPFTCGHWNPELVEYAGGIEGIGQVGKPSRTMDWQELLDWQPEVLFITCCGFSIVRTLQDLPMLERQPGWEALPCVWNEHVYIADGSAYFSRPGPRLVDGLEMLAHTLHPDVHPLPPGIPAPYRVRTRLLSRAV
ncbi:MAG TPA: cobalamin-binding protein [Chthonomonadales bacterium]|nr:cobalamin-binding protein [Chthonomonadales bacterium]